MAENTTIHFLVTGGTIDSYFDPRTDSTAVSKKTYLPEYIRTLQLYNPTDFTVIAMKDSRDLRHKDRQTLIESVKKSPHKLLIITHGTYTMPDSAQYLQESIQDIDKTVIFTGSMIPLKGFEMSDAAFNLGYAVAKVQVLPPGIYICMNGKVFSPNKVDKNRLKSRFEEVRG